MNPIDPTSRVPEGDCDVGLGVGSCCSVCGAPVQDHESEVKIEFVRADDDLGPDIHHVHIRGCINSWELEQAVQRVLACAKLLRARRIREEQASKVVPFPVKNRARP
jgi:hypothetical protein